MNAEILNKSLEEIDGEDWGKPNYPSHVVTSTHRLRKKKLEDFTIEDLRLMIGQEISLEVLIPLAIDKLSINVLAEGDYYEGDLLHSVIRIGEQYWKANSNQYLKLSDLIESADLSRIDDEEVIANIKTFKQFRIHE